MTKHWIAQALNWLAQSLEPVPHELNELDWKASFKLHEKRRTAVSNLLKEAAEKGRIKRKDPDSTSSKFVEYVPYWA